MIISVVVVVTRVAGVGLYSRPMGGVLAIVVKHVVFRLCVVCLVEDGLSIGIVSSVDPTRPIAIGQIAFLAFVILGELDITTYPHAFGESWSRRVSGRGTGSSVHDVWIFFLGRAGVVCKQRCVGWECIVGWKVSCESEYLVSVCASFILFSGSEDQERREGGKEMLLNSLRERVNSRTFFPCNVKEIKG